MKLAIVGSTDLLQPQCDIVNWMVWCVVVAENPSEVISGGADGVDGIAKETALDLGCEVKEFLPDVFIWDGGARRGFKQRNIEIARSCDELLCIRSLQSKTYRSGWTADYAEQLSKPVKRLYV